MKTLDWNSTANQRIKEKFVGDHVYQNMNMWVNDLIKNDFDAYAEAMNPYIDSQEHEDYGFGNVEEFENSGENHREILEHWSVSEYLHDAIIKHGGCAGEINNTYIWGRESSGQAILLDGIISRICQEMEILEGQKNEWKMCI